MPTPDDVLIVGGYGVVGHMIAAQLAPVFPGRIVVAGRSGAKADQACRAVGHGARPRVLDMADPRAVVAALAGVGTVMVCVAQRTPHLLQAAAERGLAYTDLSPRLAFWSGTAALDQAAQRSAPAARHGALAGDLQRHGAPARK